MEPVFQDWPLVYLELLARCPKVEDRQGTATLAALETPKKAANLSAPLHFWVEETERRARWRPLRPGTLAGLADRSPEGTEEKRAPCNAVYTALTQKGPALKSPGPLASGRSSRGLSSKNDGPQIRLRSGSATLTPTLILVSTSSDIP